ncbi:MAG: hypothetical protein ACREA7_00675 [Nitrosotalea sp.]
MNAKLLAVVMISGLALSGSSIYLSQTVFADDQWSSIAQRQLIAQQRAALVYSDKYQYDNTNGAQKNWSGLSFTTTNENTVGRDLAVGSHTSLQNALAQFDKIHVEQLQNLQSTNYTGLTSTTTDEQGRDRTTLIADARDQSLNASQSIVSQLSQIDAAYTNLQASGTTNEQNSGDRQTHIDNTWNSMEAQATALVNALSKVDTAYLNLQAGATTNENTQASQLDAEQASALGKAIQIFQEIHAKNLASTESTNYAGLTSSTTNEQNANDRNVEIEQGTQMALQNALNLYNAYYQGNGLNQTTYSN